MSLSNNLFKTLSDFKSDDDSSKSAEEKFLSYCNQVLGFVERFNVDFKEKHDRRESKLDVDDKKNLAKAVSGFANSGGGVLIWGIEDKSLKPKPITNVEEFLSNLMQLASQVTAPVVEGINGEWIKSASNKDSGYAFLHIPESELPPHRVILNINNIKNDYFFRSGNSFLVASHTQLEDMFGRRPKPNLKLATRLKSNGGSRDKRKVTVILGIENTGRGVAKFPFLAVRIHEPYQISKWGIDARRHFGLRELVRSVGDDWRKYGGSLEVAIHPGTIHEVTAVSIDVDPNLSSSHIYPLKIDYQIAADGIQLIESEEIIPGSIIWDVINTN